jgi:hypothetical protein
MKGQMSHYKCVYRSVQSSGPQFKKRLTSVYKAMHVAGACEPVPDGTKVTI